MADTKISALPASTTPLAGTEVLPIVQSSATKQVSVANLTAGRAVATAALSATGIVLTTDATDASSTTAASLKTAGGLAVVKKIYVGDNIVQGTAAKGVNFTANTPAAGMTSQLLNWYEEGTWTPNQGGGLTVIGAFTSSGIYTRTGRMVVASGQVRGATSVAINTGSEITSNLPFTTAATGIGGGITVNISANITATNVTGASGTSLYSNTTIAATPYLDFTVTYFT
jgi:hypothetical protein